MTEDMFDRLAAPFPPERVSWRVGTSNKKRRQRETGDQYAKATKGQALAYLDARDVMDRLDDVCGPGGWANRYTHADKKTVCEIGIRINGEWVWKSDGAGDSDIEAEKGALSDAFKRAAVRWGIGRYLYDVDSPWVELDEWERITDVELKRLQDILAASTTAFEWGSPEARATLRVLTNTIKSTVQTTDDVRRWREENVGVFAQMRVKAREHVNELLDRIADSAKAKEAA